MGTNVKEPNSFQGSGNVLREALTQLDDHQIVSLVQQMVDERDTLLKRQEHLSSLSRLWERTIAEADEIADKVKREAIEEAEAKAKTIVEEAKNNADVILVERRTRAFTAAQNEFRSLRQNWKQELEGLYVRSLEDLKVRFSETAAELSTAMFASLESLKGQFETFQANLDQNLAQLETAVLNTSNDSIASLATDNAEPQGEVPPSPNMGSDVQQPVMTTIEELTTQEVRTIEIMAPRDKERIESLQAKLEQIDDIVETDLKHLVDRTLVEVLLSKPLDLVGILSNWPEVEQVQERSENGQVRIQVRLGVEAEIAKGKGSLNQRINRIAHHIKPVD